MADNLTDPDFLPMNDLCNDSLRALIKHYLSVKQKLPDNLTVRDRLEELQAELINRTLKADTESEANNRTSTIEGMIRQSTDNPLWP